MYKGALSNCQLSAQRDIYTIFVGSLNFLSIFHSQACLGEPKTGKFLWHANNLLFAYDGANVRRNIVLLFWASLGPVGVRFGRCTFACWDMVLPCGLAAGSPCVRDHKNFRQVALSFVFVFERAVTSCSQGTRSKCNKTKA